MIWCVKLPSYPEGELRRLPAKMASDAIENIFDLLKNKIIFETQDPYSGFPQITCTFQVINLSIFIPMDLTIKFDRE